MIYEITAFRVWWTINCIGCFALRVNLDYREWKLLWMFKSYLKKWIGAIFKGWPPYLLTENWLAPSLLTLKIDRHICQQETGWRHLWWHVLLMTFWPLFLFTRTGFHHLLLPFSSTLSPCSLHSWLYKTRLKVLLDIMIYHA